jgi:thermitase
LWGLNAIDAPDAWDVATDCAGKVVAIIDTGADLNHLDLAANIAPGGYDFVNDDTFPMDPLGHGTHVAGPSRRWEITPEASLGSAGAVSRS